MKKGLLLSVLAMAAMAQAVEFDGQVRYRLENGNYAFDSNVDAYNHANLRAQVGLKAEPQDGVNVYVQAHTNRLINGSAAENALDLHQAYVNWNCLLVPGLGVTVGRFELAKADQRFFGIDEWQATPTAHDGFVLSYGTPFTKIDLYSSKVVEAAVAKQDAANWGLYFNNIMDKKVDLFFNISDMGEDALKKKNSFNTLGLHYDNTYFDKLGVNVNFATQSGTNEATKMDYTGMMFGLDASWDLGMGYLNKVGFGYESTSAANPDSSDYGWQELYGAAHKFHGYQDIAGPNPFGLNDLQLNFQGALPMGLNYKLDYHMFSSVEKFTIYKSDPTDPLSFDVAEDTTIGSEIDFSLAKQVDNFTVNLGYSIFTPEANFSSKNASTVGDAQSWMYFQVAAGF